ncbi:MAG: M28 family peptidase [Pyrinomonadaceae bacterium]|nr:M28 family peptidase [Phycisphaerales bacterium]
MIVMPGVGHRGALDPLTPQQGLLAAQLRADVERLASDLGGRSIFYPRRLAECAVFLDDSLKAAGYATTSYTFVVHGTSCPNIEVVLPGTSKPDEVIVVGAHYDAFQGSPAADDNASGVAAVLALARAFHGQPAARTLRFVLFVNEEPPSFMTADMGSLVYARGCKVRGDRVVAMLSLETIGYYTDAERSQHYPPPLGQLYPSRGNFIAFVGNYSSRRLVRDSIASFREHARFPSEGAALFGGIPGVGWSDHWAFWQCGYPAIMVTDTAPFRNPNYHTAADTPETLDYERMARVVEGLHAVIADLANR